MDEDKRAEVVRFLAEFKKAACVGHVQFVERLENNETIQDLGFNKRVCEDLILALSTDDYATGPDEDGTGRDNFGSSENESAGRATSSSIFINTVGATMSSAFRSTIPKPHSRTRFGPRVT